MTNKVLKIMVIKIFTGFEKRGEDLSETLNKERKCKKEPSN